MSKYCAVRCQTESGDDYLYLFKYENPSEIGSLLLDKMGEELAYVYAWDAEPEMVNDKGKIERFIGEAIEESREEEGNYD